MATSQFSKALANKKQAMAKMREVEQKVFTLPTIADGEYTFAVDAECGVTDNKGIPYVKFNWSVQDEGPAFGKGNNQIFWLDGDDEEQVEKTFQRLAGAFMSLLDLTEVTVDDPQDIEQLVDMVNDEDNKTYATGKLSNWTSASGKKGFNLYFKKRVAVEA